MLITNHIFSVLMKRSDVLLSLDGCTAKMPIATKNIGCLRWWLFQKSRNRSKYKDSVSHVCRGFEGCDQGNLSWGGEPPDPHFSPKLFLGWRRP